MSKIEIEEIHESYNRVRAKAAVLKKDLEHKTNCAERERKGLECLVKARFVLIEAGKVIQERFKTRVENLVNIAIRSVFDRPFRFVLEFEQRKNKLECHPYVEENGSKYVPKDEMGGGILPVISFALRVVLWSLQRPRSRNVILLDEPMGGTGSLIRRASQMIKEISSRLKIQIIMPTHSEELIEIADVAYGFVHDGKQSNVKLIKNNFKKF